MSKYRARCNKRACQARKTLRGTYDENDRVPCHITSCKGVMRIDVTRERDCTKYSSGGRGLCQCDGMQWADMRGSPHRRGAHGCKHHNEVVTKRNLAPRSKHSPIAPEDWVPF